MKSDHTFKSSVFLQLDGACDMSLDDSQSLSPENTSWFSQPDLQSPSQLDAFPTKPIPVFTSQRTDTPSWSNLEKRKKFFTTIRRNNKAVAALALPIITVYNMRSIWLKLDCLATDMVERSADLSILAEVWEKKENSSQEKIEELFEMKNIKYSSTPRPGTKRGGGVAFTAREDKFQFTKLNIAIPKPLEVKWGLLRPRESLGGISKIIICSFYSPPNSRKKSSLIDHLSLTINNLKIIHPKANFIIAGDKNDLKEGEIVAICPSFKQIVLKPTRKDKILTIVVTDLQNLYQEPIIIPPVPVDEGSSGSPSDHNGVLLLPITNFHSQPRTKKKVTIRPIPDSSLNNFGKTFVNESFDFLLTKSSPTTLVELFQNHCSEMIETFFPMKTVTISSYDQPFFTERLRALRRERQREYRRSGKSEKYKNIKENFDQLFKKEATKYKNKVVNEVIEGKRGSAYKAIRKLASGVSFDGSFSLPSHAEANLSPQQSAEILADHFSKISQEFHPLDIANLPPKLQDELLNNKEQGPLLQDHQVYKKIMSAKKPDSAVPGDLPKKVVKAFAVELASPVTIIFNAITTNGEYPRQWVIEHQTAIPKVNPPTCEDDLRNISGTPFLSKVYESFLSDWLLPIVTPYLDPANCGGLEGTSSSHYMIRLLHFIHSTVDKTEPHAVVMALIDLSKAFNRVDHLLVIQDLHDMRVPPWLLRILISYLTGRTMKLRFKGAMSSPKSLPGSAPQGVFLGCFFFMVKFNGALLRPSVPRPFPKPAPIMYSKQDYCTVKYIDDASQACSINLKQSLFKIDTTKRPYPLEFSEHTGYGLIPEKNMLQKDLNLLENFTKRNLMIINQKKTEIMKFNFRKSLDFPPIFTIGGPDYLNIVSKTRLLGFILSFDLKWHQHVDFMCQKAMKKTFLLRKLKILELESNLLLDFYLKEIRSILEYGVPVWHSGLTIKMSEKIERVQKICVSIILCSPGKHISYTVGCTLLGIEPLYMRRTELCVRFIQKTSLEPKHSDMFFETDYTHNTRQKNRQKYKEFSYRSKRFYNSPLCYLTRLLNSNPTKL